MARARGSGLEERSRAPRRQARAIGEGIAEEILDVRRAHPRWGPRKILGTFDKERLDLPAASTVGALLKREGLVPVRRKRQRVPSYTAPLAHAAAPNQVGARISRAGSGAAMENAVIR